MMNCFVLYEASSSSLRYVQIRSVYSSPGTDHWSFPPSFFPLISSHLSPVSQFLSSSSSLIHFHPVLLFLSSQICPLIPVHLFKYPVGYSREPKDRMRGGKEREPKKIRKGGERRKWMMMRKDESSFC